MFRAFPSVAFVDLGSFSVKFSESDGFRSRGVSGAGKWNAAVFSARSAAGHVVFVRKRKWPAFIGCFVDKNWLGGFFEIFFSKNKKTWR